MNPREIKEQLENRHPFLTTTSMRTQNVSQKIAYFIHGVAAEYDEPQKAVLGYLEPWPASFFNNSFPVKTFEELSHGSVSACTIFRLVSDISWKQVGKGEILMNLKGGLRKDPKQTGDGFIGLKKYNVKNIVSGACLRSRPNEERHAVDVDKLVRVYFDGHRFGMKKGGSHAAAIEIAKKKGLPHTTEFFKEVYGPRFSSKECENIASSLISDNLPADDFNQLVGARIHLEDARLDDIEGYMLITEQGIIHLLRNDIIDHAVEWGLKYDVKLHRGKDTNSLPDGYAVVREK